MRGKIIDLHTCSHSELVRISVNVCLIQLAVKRKMTFSMESVDCYTIVPNFLKMLRLIALF